MELAGARVSLKCPIGSANLFFGREVFRTYDIEAVHALVNEVLF